jgi:hypothetical protein
VGIFTELGPAEKRWIIARRIAKVPGHESRANAIPQRYVDLRPIFGRTAHVVLAARITKFGRNVWAKQVQYITCREVEGISHEVAHKQEVP